MPAPEPLTRLVLGGGFDHNMKRRGLEHIQSPGHFQLIYCLRSITGGDDRVPHRMFNNFLKTTLD